MSNPSFISIISPIGNVVEQLDVDIIPHEENDNEYDEILESPRELIGQSPNFKIVIIGAKDLPVNFCGNLKIEYQTFYDRPINSTKLHSENDSNLTEFKIEEEFEHKIDYLTKEDIDFIEKEKYVLKYMFMKMLNKRKNRS